MLEKFPGLLGYGGIIAIHADWPNYPSGIGWEIALKTLGNFPDGTKFYEISDIDRCKLLINLYPKNLKDPYDEKYYHSAIWHTDLIELHEKGLISGIIKKSEFEFELYRFEEFKKQLGQNLKEDDEGNIILFYKDKNGNYEETKYQKPISEEDEDWIYRECVIIPNTIKLTKKGILELTVLSKGIEFSQEINNLTQPLLQLERFDTAIREASLLIETSIKKLHDVNLFGQRLIEFHIKDVVKNNDDFYSAAIKCYRGELRTIFSFIRNDFAHNFKILTEGQCRVILQRIDQTFNEFKEVNNTYYKNKNNT